MAVSVYISINSAGGFSFLHILSNIYCLQIFWWWPPIHILTHIYMESEYSLEGLMLKMKLQYFGHLMQKTDSLEKTLMLGMVEGKRRRGWQRTRWLDGISDSEDMGLRCAAVHGIAKSQTKLNNWTTTIWNLEKKGTDEPSKEGACGHSGGR